MRYRNLIFDLYGTLVDIHTDEDAPLLWQKMALLYGYYGARYTPESLHDAYLKALQAQNAAAGQSYEGYPDLPIEPIFAGLFTGPEDAEAASLGAMAARFFRALSTDYIRLYPGVREALEALRKAGYKLYLLSNAQAAYTAQELCLLELVPCFDEIYLSSDYACRKPDARFFKALLDGQSLDPETCLMIGNDATTDIAGARALGIDTLYLHTNLSPACEGNPATWRLDETDWNRILPELLSICK